MSDQVGILNTRAKDEGRRDPRDPSARLAQSIVAYAALVRRSMNKLRKRSPSTPVHIEAFGGSLPP
jgi:hypothetical protein